MCIYWNLYKKSGKWAYKGKSNIPYLCNIYDDNIIDIIADNQDDVYSGVIKSREYNLVCTLDYNSIPIGDTKFFEIMYPAI